MPIWGVDVDLSPDVDLSLSYITTVLKVETDIITSIAASLTGWAVILVIMYVEIFKTSVIVFIGDIKMCLMSHWPIIFNIRVSSCTCKLRTDLIFLSSKVRSVIQNLSAAHIKEKMPNLLINNFIYMYMKYL